MSNLESEAVRARYERRKSAVELDRYSLLNPSVWQGIHERQRVMLQLFTSLGLRNFNDTKLIEVGCGAGGNLLELLRLGFQPENMVGIELLEDRVAQAQKVLPGGMVQGGDANTANITPSSVDIVYQSTVFSSLLDSDFQAKLAERMWTWVKPGGGVLWYDFIYNNPNNPDVRGVSIRRVRELFPQGGITTRRVTLAPPIARRVCKLHPSLYTVFNVFPFLCTHIVCWIGKSTER